MIEHEPALVARAWHDITCPEGADCRDRLLHSASQTIANTGHLALFLARVEELEAPRAGDHVTAPYVIIWPRLVVVTLAAGALMGFVGVWLGHLFGVPPWTIVGFIGGAAAGYLAQHLTRDWWRAYPPAARFSGGSETGGNR